MSPETAANLALSIIMVIAAIIFRAYVRETDAFRKEVDRRFDEAGSESSKLATAVQVLMGMRVDIARLEAQVDELMRDRGGLRRQK